jgi:hypothetical protein
MSDGVDMKFELGWESRQRGVWSRPNFAEQYFSFQKRKRWPGDGKKYKHRIQEAAQAEQRNERAGLAFDEF